MTSFAIVPSEPLPDVKIFGECGAGVPLIFEICPRLRDDQCDESMYMCRIGGFLHRSAFCDTLLWSSNRVSRSQCSFASFQDVGVDIPATACEYLFAGRVDFIEDRVMRRHSHF